LKVRINKENIGILLCYCLIYFGNAKLLFHSMVSAFELAQCVILFLSVAYVAKYRTRSIGVPSVDVILFFVFIVTYLVAASYSPSSIAVKTIITSTVINVVFIVLVYLIAHEIDIGKFVSFSVIINVLMVCAYLVFNANLILTYLRLSHRLESLSLPNPIWVARFVGDTILLAWMQYWCTKTKKARKIAIISLIPLLIMLLISGSKGPVVAIAIATLYYWVFKTTNSNGKIKLIFGLILLLAVAFCAVTFLDFSRINGYFRFDSIFDLRRGSRLHSYFYALAMIPKSIFKGYGLGSWGIMYYGEDSYYYPHNIVLEILFESGLIAFIPFMVMYIRFFVNNKIKTIPYAYVMSCMTVYYLVCSLFSGGLMSGNKNVFIFWVVTLTTLKERTQKYNMYK